MRIAVLGLSLVAVVAAGCSRESVYFVPGENARAHSNTAAPEPATGAPKRVTVALPGGSTLEGGISLDELGVEVPPGAELKKVKSPIARVTTPEGERVAASLVTSDGPAAVVAFYEERHELSMKSLVNDAASLSATLEDGRLFNVTLGAPRKNGLRDLAVSVTRPAR